MPSSWLTFTYLSEPRLFYAKKCPKSARSSFRPAILATWALSPFERLLKSSAHLPSNYSIVATGLNSRPSKYASSSTRSPRGSKPRTWALNLLELTAYLLSFLSNLCYRATFTRGVYSIWSCLFNWTVSLVSTPAMLPRSSSTRSMMFLRLPSSFLIGGFSAITLASSRSASVTLSLSFNSTAIRLIYKKCVFTISF